MKNPDGIYSRRKFLKKNAVAGIGAVVGTGFLSPLLAQASPKTLKINPRYHRWHVDPGVEWLETNTGYATLDWEIPLDQTAVVLVDVWQRHYLKDTEERGGK